MFSLAVMHLQYSCGLPSLLCIYRILVFGLCFCVQNSCGWRSLLCVYRILVFSLRGCALTEPLWLSFANVRLQNPFWLAFAAVHLQNLCGWPSRLCVYRIVWLAFASVCLQNRVVGLRCCVFTEFLCLAFAAMH